MDLGPVSGPNLSVGMVPRTRWSAASGVFCHVLWGVVPPGDRVWAVVGGAVSVAPVRGRVAL